MSVTTAPTPGQAPTQHITPEQMLRLPDDGRLYELVDGQLVEKHMSDMAQLVANRLNDEFVLWGARSQTGRPFVEATFQCFPFKPDMVRRPDVAFVSGARLQGYEWGQAHLRIAPDLPVEVLSPGDEVYSLDRKIAEYFQAGVRRVWVINPEQRTVRIHRGPGDISELIGDADMGDELVLPGFHCKLSTVFVEPAPQAASG